MQLAGGGVHESGAEVVAESEVAVGRLGLAQALRVAACAVFLSGGAELVVVEAGAGEERLFAWRLVVLVLGEVFAGEVDHEDGSLVSLRLSCRRRRPELRPKER